MRVLLVEDERALAEPLKEILKANNIQCDISFNGEDGLNFALLDIYDVIILDVMLPILNGFEVLKKIRENYINTPIIMLTALSDIPNRVKGLNYGADDYLSKPFSTEELLARIRALSRRKDIPILESKIKGSNINLDKTNSKLIMDNNVTEVSLSLKELSVFEVLIDNYPNICSKELILDKVWGFDDSSDLNNVEVYVSFLRKKINFLNGNLIIQTVRGIGYKIEVENV